MKKKQQLTVIQTCHYYKQLGLLPHSKFMRLIFSPICSSDYNLCQCMSSLNGMRGHNPRDAAVCSFTTLRISGHETYTHFERHQLQKKAKFHWNMTWTQGKNNQEKKKEKKKRWQPSQSSVQSSVHETWDLVFSERPFRY